VKKCLFFNEQNPTTLQWQEKLSKVKAIIILLIQSLCKNYVKFGQSKPKLSPAVCIDLIFGVLMPLSAIFQLYHGDQF
jgi:hypothetical protein